MTKKVFVAMTFKRSVLTLVMVGLMSTVTLNRVHAHDPEGEYVQSMVRPAVRYLEEGYSQGEYGEEALVAYTLLKAGKDPELTPRITKAVEKIQDFVASNPNAESEWRLYSVCVSCILLCELSPSTYDREIQVLLGLIVDRQLEDGGWGYIGRPTGDVSQTQYCCLALWSAQNAGYRIHPNVGSKALMWLMTVQDVGGGWPYQGIYQGPLVRIQQGSVTPSLAAAGLGSVYILADWLGYGQEEGGEEQERQSDGLPPAVTLVEEDGETVEEEQLVEVNVTALRACKQSGNAWFANFNPDARAWPYYYLYGYERYASFREKAQGVSPKEPRWYNLGAEYLKSKQVDGAWSASETDESDDIATSFALLFLLRGTKKTIGLASWTDGALRGGQGLRDDAQTAMHNGRVVNLPVARDISQLMGLIDNADEDELEFFAEAVESLDLSDPNMSQTQKRAVLYNFINHDNHSVRLVAARTLGNVRDMENVPALIFAITDPDFTVARAANDGLKFISRKMDGYEISESPTMDELQALKSRWVDWYLDLVPEGQLLD